MTLPHEELNALKNTREFLRMLNRMNMTEIRKDAKLIKEMAYSCLRHYPWDMYLEPMYKDRIDNELK